MSKQKTIDFFVDNTFEHPFGEGVKLLLRLEIIFNQAAEHKQARNQYETRMCLDSLFALLNITSRYELRSVMLKELERINKILLHFKSSGEVSKNRVYEVLSELNSCKSALHKLVSKNIDSIRNIEFLNTVKLRNIHETGGYLFEIPELHHWLLQDQGHRAEQIQKWLGPFTPFAETTSFLLQLIRDSAEYEKYTAKNGIYIKTVSNKLNKHQLLRIKVDKKYSVFPSISGDSYRFVIRFMKQRKVDERATQAVGDIEFYLETCGV